jgi:ABC-type branched-subunit amino acid transport system substrate-binding protein
MGHVIEVNEVVKPLDIPLISPLATSSDLIDKDMHPTFFRTIQGDVTLSVAMSKLAKALNFRV